MLRPHGRTPFPWIAKLEVFPDRADMEAAVQKNHQSMARPVERHML
jgi:hypothetical protein